MVTAAEVLQNSTANTTINTLFIAIVVIMIIGGFLLWRYFKSFNIAVEIRRPIGGQHGGYVFEKGHKGRYVFKSNSQNEKVTVFQILNAKKYKLEFNGDAPDERYKIQDVDKNGRVSIRIILEPDSENQLHPVELKPTMGKYGDRHIDAAISRGDIQFAATSIKEMNDKYNDKNFLEKHSFLIIMILFLFIAILYWFGAKNYSDSAAQMAAANTALSNAFTTWSNAMLHNSTVAGTTSAPILLG